ncbi:MAG: hypothetical protein SFU53_13955 [Terrimicrobiaceae bacterium]|nr:hypothetical protein [Terrimicrobiaceae bacterium]
MNILPLRSRFFLSGVIFLGGLSGPLRAQDQPVDLTVKMAVQEHGGSTVQARPTEVGLEIRAQHPGEGGRGTIGIPITPFEGPLERITYRARGTVGHCRLGVRDSNKVVFGSEIEKPGPELAEYSIDFGKILGKLSASNQTPQYPLLEVVLSFRFDGVTEESLDLADVTLHRPQEPSQ